MRTLYFIMAGTLIGIGIVLLALAGFVTQWLGLWPLLIGIVGFFIGRPFRK